MTTITNLPASSGAKSSISPTNDSVLDETTNMDVNIEHELVPAEHQPVTELGYNLGDHENPESHQMSEIDQNALAVVTEEDDPIATGTKRRRSSVTRRAYETKPRKIRNPRKSKQLQLTADSITFGEDGQPSEGLLPSVEPSEAVPLKKGRLPTCDLYDWNAHFAALVHYGDAHGHCNVPFKLTYECTLPGLDNGSDLYYKGNLGRWLDRQRQTRKGHRPDPTLRPERESRLQELVDQGKLMWTASQKKDSWYRTYLALLEYGKIHGHCNVPAKTVFECDLPHVDGPGPDGAVYDLQLNHYKGNLGTWVEHQRQSYKGKGTKLYADRQAYLQELVDKGMFMWDASEFSSSSMSKQLYETNWPLNYAALLEYYKEHGHCNVPIHETYECQLPAHESYGSATRYSGKLGRWLQVQRMAKRGSQHVTSISAERLALLQVLVDEGKLWWDALMQRDLWEKQSSRRAELAFLAHYAALLEYGVVHGDCNAPRGMNPLFECEVTSVSDPWIQLTYRGDLGLWLHRQRQSRRGLRYKLSAERRSLLHRLVGEGRLAWDLPEGGGLATGGSRQSDSGYCAPLPTNQEQTDTWNRNYYALLQFTRENGHSQLPISQLYQCQLPDGSVYQSNLGLWLFSQRLRKNGSRNRPPLAADREALLQQLVDDGKFTWDNGIPRTSATGAGVTDMSDANWPKHYAALLEFVKERGHSNIPTQFMYTCDLLNAGSNGRSYHYRGDLGQWLALQRRAKAMRAAGHNSGLLPEREALLQRLVDEGHLSWSSFFGAAGLTQRETERLRWLLHSAALLDYCHEHGNCNISIDTVYTCDLSSIVADKGVFRYTGQLGRWLANELSTLARDDQSARAHGLLTRRAHQSVPERRSFIEELIAQGKLNMASLPIAPTSTYTMPAPGPLQTCDLNITATIGAGSSSSSSRANPALNMSDGQGDAFGRSGGSNGDGDPEAQEMSWLGHFLALVEYGRVHGHCNVPLSAVFECELPGMQGLRFLYVGSLGVWLAKQRLARQGVAARLLPERDLLLQRLVDEGMLSWITTPVLMQLGPRVMGEPTWDDHYQALLEYCNQVGDCDVPIDLEFESVLPSSGRQYRGQLGIWLLTQKLSKLGVYEPLSDERDQQIQQLMDEGRMNSLVDTELVLPVGSDLSWLAHYAALLHYACNNGHCNVPYTALYECDLPWLDEDGDSLASYHDQLGVWLFNQRLSRRSGVRGNSPPLLPEREALLQQLVDEGLLLWEGAGDAANTFIDSVNVSAGGKTIPSAVRILSWDIDVLRGRVVSPSRRPVVALTVIDSNTDCSSSNSASQHARLADTRSRETVTGVDLRGQEMETLWEKHHAALLEYGQQSGHCNVPADVIFECMLPGGEKYIGSLGEWLMHQRRLHVQHQLRPDREAIMQLLVAGGRLSWPEETDRGRAVTGAGEEGGDSFESQDSVEWDMHYAALIEWGKEHGHCNVGVNTTYRCLLSRTVYDAPLGRWLHDMVANAHRLTPIQKALIQQLKDEGKLDVDLSPIQNPASDGSEFPWTVHYAALVEYGGRHGHFNVPFETKYECDLMGEGPGGTTLHYSGNLGIWLYKQRLSRAGRGAKLPSDCEALLSSLVSTGKLHWDISSIGDKVGGGQQGETNWNSHYSALLEYCKEHGHCNVPKQATYECVLPVVGEGGVNVKYFGHLGSWLCYQRRLRKREKGRLQSDREALLQQLVDEGFLLWDISRGKHTHQSTIPWNDHYAALLQYAAEYGHCNVSRKMWYECTLPANGQSPPKQYRGQLGSWLLAQRTKIKRESSALGPGEPMTQQMIERAAAFQLLVDEGKLSW